MTALTERTSRAIVGMTWACAGIVMVTSAGNAVLTFGELGGNRAIGLGLGIAVDVALCVGLIGDRRLAANGLTSAWGRVVRVIAAAMSVVLNVGAAMIAGHYFLAALHAFLPVLLVVLTEYGQDVLLKLTELARDEADRAAPTISDPAPSEPGSGGLGRAGSDPTLAPTWNAPLGHSGNPAGRGDTVLPASDGLDLFASPPDAGSITSPARPPSLGPGWPAAGRLVVAPLPVPDRPEVPVRPSGAGRPAAPGRKRPARTGSDSKRAGAAVRSDEQLVQAARELASRSDGRLTQYAVRQAFGLGSTRAARLLAQLDPVPAGPPATNGEAHVKESK